MELPKRKLLRLKDYDYNQNGAYFITICAKDKRNLFGKIKPPNTVAGIPQVVGAALAPPVAATDLTEYGKNVQKHIEALHKHYNYISVDKYVIMPNHVHMIISINTGVAEMRHADEHATPAKSGHGTGGASAAPTTLGNLVRGFKAGVSRECGFLLWQRSYHDHIIRNQKDYLRIYQYIETNPAKWEDDRYFHKD